MIFFVIDVIIVYKKKDLKVEVQLSVKRCKNCWNWSRRNKDVKISKRNPYHSLVCMIKLEDLPTGCSTNHKDLDLNKNLNLIKYEIGKSKSKFENEVWNWNLKLRFEIWNLK